MCIVLICYFTIVTDREWIIWHGNAPGQVPLYRKKWAFIGITHMKWIGNVQHGTGGHRKELRSRAENQMGMNSMTWRRIKTSSPLELKVGICCFHMNFAHEKRTKEESKHLVVEPKMRLYCSCVICTRGKGKS